MRLFLSIWRSRNVFLMAGVAFLALLLFGMAFAPQLAPYGVNHMDVARRLSAPSARHLFGTDNFGRDIFSRVLFGSRISLLIGVSVALASTAAGALVGMAAATFRRVDNLLMRVLDGLMAFPTIFLAIGLIAALGGGAWQEITAMSVAFFPRTARIMRGVTLELRNSDFVGAAVAAGATPGQIMVNHIIRNGFGPLMVQMMYVVAQSIVFDAGLSFLGLGVPPPTPTWGNMLGDAQAYMEQAWWYVTFPGVVIALTVMSINLVGDALRDLLDPKLRRG